MQPTTRRARPILRWAVGVFTWLLGLTLSAPAGTVSDYQLSPHDLVHIAVQGEGDLSLDRRISADGTIELPYIGAVAIGGITVDAAEALIRDNFVKKEIYVRPFVLLNVLEFSLRSFSVLGEVRNPGKYNFPNRVKGESIVEAIAAAGGFTRISKIEMIRVRRKGANGVQETFVIDASKLLSNTNNEEAFQIFPDDVIFVPERTF